MKRSVESAAGGGGKDYTLRKPGQHETFPCDVGEIKRINGSNSHFYYCVAVQGGFSYNRLVGESSLDDVRLFYGNLFSDKNRKLVNKTLADLRWSRTSRNFDEAIQVSRDVDGFLESHGLEPVTLTILSSDDLEFGMGRMFESLNQKRYREIHLVRNLDSAVESLDIKRGLLDVIIAEIDRLESV